METARRVYLYVIAAASLGMLIVGITTVGATLVDIMMGGALRQTTRERLASAGALCLVGLPIWAIHWGIANRTARMNEADRRSALRQLYLYGTAGALMLAFSAFAVDLVRDVLHAVVPGGRRVDAVEEARQLWQALVGFAFWGYQFREAARDRASVGETAAAATIRRWYAYAVQLVALLVMLTAARELLASVANALIAPTRVLHATATIDTAGALVVTALIWLFHASWSDSGEIGLADRASTLRAVYGFLILLVSVALTLVSAGSVMNEVLARSMGAARPGGVAEGLLEAVVDPMATMAIFGTAWALIRYRLQRDADAAATLPAHLANPRRDAVRRLSTHLIALVSLMALASGLTGVVWTMSDQILGVRSAATDGWRDQLSLSLSLLAVGMVAWLGHWQPAPPLPERIALSRRLYLFGVLLLSVLGLLGSGAALMYSAIGLAIGVPGVSASTLGRALGSSVIAAGVGGYHWQVIRADLAARRTAEPPPPPAASPEATVVEIVGASEAEIRRALERLPRAASYSLRAASAEAIDRAETPGA